MISNQIQDRGQDCTASRPHKILYVTITQQNCRGPVMIRWDCSQTKSLADVPLWSPSSTHKSGLEQVYFLKENKNLNLLPSTLPEFPSSEGPGVTPSLHCLQTARQVDLGMDGGALSAQETSQVMTMQYNVQTRVPDGSVILKRSQQQDWWGREGKVKMHKRC